MKILLGVHKFFPTSRTGTEVLTLELARGLRKRGHEVSILTGEPHENDMQDERPWLGQDTYDDFPVSRLHYDNRKAGDPVHAHFSAPDRLQLVHDAVASTEPDIVHFTHLRAFSSQVIPELKQSGVPVLFTPTDFWVVCPKFQLYRDYEEVVCPGPDAVVDCLRCCRPMPTWAARVAVQLSRTPLKRYIRRVAAVDSLSQRLHAVVTDVNAADRILPATNFLAEVLTRFGVLADKINVLPYGIDIGELPPKRTTPRHFSAEEPLHLGFIGSLLNVKGPHVILKALRLLGEERRKLIFDIYGKVDLQDSYVRNLQELAKESGVEVDFRGTFPHERIGEVLRGMHVLIVPSTWYESTPLVLCSALAAGTFVLVSRLGGMTEAIVEGETGFSFAAGDAEDLANRVRMLLNVEVDLSALPPKQLLRQRGTADYVVEVEEHYQNVLKSRREG